MSATHNTSNGRRISIEKLRLENEHTIAVGNMKVNARGDSLGPGGVPIATRQQAVNEYYNLHTPVAGGKPAPVAATPPVAQTVLREQQFDAPVADSADPLIEEQDAATPEPTTSPEPVAASSRPVRGSLASTLKSKK
jgi:hypothetical protein